MPIINPPIDEQRISMKTLLFGLFSLFILGSCSTIQNYPYFDSAIHDRNRAPSSIEVPTSTEAEYSKKDWVDKRSDADSLYLQAELKSQQGESKAAVKMFEKVAEMDTQSDQLYHRIANEYFRLSQVKESLVWTEKALKLNPQNKESLLLAAGLYSSSKDYVKAEKIYKQLIQNYKDDPESYLYLAALYAEQKKYDKAMIYFGKAEKFDDYSQKHLVYYYRARTWIEKDGLTEKSKIIKDLKLSLKSKVDFFEGLQLLAKIIERTEGSQKTYNFIESYQKENGPFPVLAEILSQYYLKKADYDKAFEQLEVIEGATKDPIEVKLKMALILIDKKIYDRAIVRLEELNQIAPDSDKIKYYLAAIYDETKKYDQAIAVYQQIPVDSGYYEESMKRVAYIYKSQFKVDQAIAVLEKLIKDKPMQMQSYLALASFYENIENYEKAEALLIKAENKFTDNTSILFNLAIIFDKQNKKNQMFDYMKKVIAKDSNHAQALNYVAYSLMDMNKDMDRAEELALKAYSIDSEDPYIADTVGWLYYKKGEYTKSLVYLTKAYKMVPNVGIIVDHLADVYMKLNKVSKAITLYKKALTLETDDIKKKAIMDKLSKTTPEKNRFPASMTAVEADDVLSTDGLGK